MVRCSIPTEVLIDHWVLWCFPQKDLESEMFALYSLFVKEVEGVSWNIPLPTLDWVYIACTNGVI